MSRLDAFGKQNYPRLYRLMVLAGMERAINGFPFCDENGQYAYAAIKEEEHGQGYSIAVATEPDFLDADSVSDMMMLHIGAVEKAHPVNTTQALRSLSTLQHPTDA